MLTTLYHRIIRPLRYLYLRTMRTKASPHFTALGIAVGVFVGFLPIIPFQTFVAIGLAFLFRCGKIASALGTWVTNPFNAPLMYFLFYKLGRIVIPLSSINLDPEHLRFMDLLDMGWKTLAAMFLGGIFLGIPCSIIAYFLSLGIIRRYHVLRFKRLERKRQKLKRKRKDTLL